MPSEANPRARLYGLLARLLLDELDQPLACYLRGLPGLAEHIPPDAELGGWLADMRAERQRLLELNIYPYESIFRDRELMLNTAAALRVGTLYAACGFEPAAALRVGAPDHLGLELALMAELAARAPLSKADRARAAVLLHNHLATWLPACAEAISRVAHAPLYHALVDLAVELVLSDLEAFAPDPPHPQPRSPGGSGAQVDGIEQAIPLSPVWERGLGGEGENFDLRQLVNHLLTPDAVGVFICRADVATIGHALGLPAPIAERSQMLRGLFEAAGRFEQVPALLAALSERLHAADATYMRLMGAYPAWELYGQVWRRRVADGLGLLERLSHDLEKIEDRR